MLKNKKVSPVFTTSKKYWTNRYRHHGSPGVCSQYHLAEFKADGVNSFMKKNKIDSVIDFECGDGNQLKHLSLKQYLGFNMGQKR